MAGEQEAVDGYILRFAMKGAIQSLNWLIQLAQELQEVKGGEVSYEELSKGKNVTSVLAENLKDSDAFRDYCLDHDVKYALTIEEDGNEYFWIEATDQGELQNFLEVFLSKEELEKMAEGKAEGEINQFLEEKINKEEILNFNELENSPEYKEAKEAYDQAFNDIKTHLAETYDEQVVNTLEGSDHDVEFTSFNDLKDKNELQTFMKELNKIDPSIEVVVLDDVLKKNMKVASLDLEDVKSKHQDQELLKQKEVTLEPQYAIFENPDKEGAYDKVGFESFEELKAHLSKQYDAILPDDLVVNNKQIHSFKDATNSRDIEALVEQLQDKKVDIAFEKESVMNKFKRAKIKVQNELKDLQKDKSQEKSKEKDKETVTTKEDR